MTRGRPKSDFAAHRHPLYVTWQRMHRRCNSPKDKNYPGYGARGIRVCDRWKDFWAFVSDMGPKPSPMHTIEREDNAGGYDPFNCSWALPKTQQNNKRSNLPPITHNGETRTIAEWAAHLGMPYGVLRKRLKEMDVGKALSLAYPAPRGTFHR